MRLLLVAGALSLAAGLAGAEVSFSFVPFAGKPEATIRGAAFEPPVLLFTWDAGIRLRRLPAGEAAQITEGAGYGPGGCVMDVNRDGRPDLVVLERASAETRLGRLIWLEAPLWRRHLIDSDADFRDCLEVTLHGRRGLLVIHRYAQIRFYLVPEEAARPWPYRELYSIYTASRQGGLLLADIDEDGLADIVAGNYWLRSPERFDLSWRLFAINLWMEGPDSAMSRVAFARLSREGPPELVVCQTDVDAARLAVFRRPEPVTELWREHRLGMGLHLRRLAALAAGDLDGDGVDEVVVGENAGEGSRLVVFWNHGGQDLRPVTLAKTRGLTGLWLHDVDGDGDRDIIGVGPGLSGWWRNQRRR